MRLLFEIAEKVFVAAAVLCVVAMAAMVPSSLAALTAACIVGACLSWMCKECF